ncbi:hypothetical protein N3K66_001160 [Trichothecium roseum]|uniref:Uncharacterized protein n=1 Tax=Trichothecium roseum TaxID=47278 RepID=A0ACC0VDV5_9HYPO|nr:hypothetical protein N3K66_001160 [Trichothecium roseum]
MFCDHACQNTCHGQTPCNESAPCPAKATVTCPCGLNKQEVKCQSSSSNPTPARPELKCDDECLRQERNRRLATALNIDPNTHQDDHVPYADTTLRLFQDHTSWAESQEREFRVFASSAKEGVLRYKPMPSHQRQFLHALAEDYGLESASEDVEPYRYVVVYKSPRFVSAPSKTLAQCVKIRATQAAAAQAATAAASSAASSKPHTPAPAKSPDPYNALLLTSPRFGLTIEEVHQALDAAFASQPSLHLKIDFLPTDEVAVRAAAQYSALMTPSATEEALAALKPKVAEAAASSKLAAKVTLCHLDADQAVTRREDFARPDASGWSAVAGRAAARREAPAAASSLAEDADPARGAGKKKILLGLRRKKPAEGAGGGTSGWASKLDGDVEC